MRAFSMAVAVAGSLLAAPALADPANPGTQCIETPENAEAFKLANGIVEAIIPADQSDRIMRQLMSAIGQQMRTAWIGEVSDPGLQTIIDRYLDNLPKLLSPVTAKHIPDQKRAIACAYTHEFSIEELREAAAFAATPAGKHYLSRSSAVLSDPAVAASNQAYLADAKTVVDAAETELKAQVTSYLAAKKKK